MVKSHLEAGDWTEAGLAALAEGGVAAIAVEPLAHQVGATKGSFYWHFKSRPALVAAVLDLWEQRYVTGAIERLSEIADPRARVRRLLVLALSDPYLARIDAALADAAANDPAVAERLERTTRRRIEFLAASYAEMGFDSGRARLLAVLAHAAITGLAVVDRAAPAAIAGFKDPGSLAALLVPRAPRRRRAAS